MGCRTPDATGSGYWFILLRIHAKRRLHTVDGRNPANQLRLAVYSIIYRVLYIPSGTGFLPSKVAMLTE